MTKHRAVRGIIEIAPSGFAGFWPFILAGMLWMAGVKKWPMRLALVGVALVILGRFL